MDDNELLIHFKKESIEQLGKSLGKFNFTIDTDMSERIKEIDEHDLLSVFLLRSILVDIYNENKIIHKIDNRTAKIGDIIPIFSKKRKSRELSSINLITGDDSIQIGYETVLSHIDELEHYNDGTLSPHNIKNLKCIFKDLENWQRDLLYKDDPYDDFLSFASKRLNDDTQNFKKLDEAQYQLFFQADFIYILKLFGVNFNEEALYEWYMFHFDFDAWRAPFAIHYYPEELKKHQRMLFAWFDKELKLREEHFNTFNPDYCPIEYMIIYDFKNSLINTEDIKEWRNQYDRSDFPKSIFSSYKAYKLFEAYDEDESFKSADLSFIFYKMSYEIDKDYRIIANKQQFMEWYRDKTVDKEPVDINTPKSRALAKESKQFTYRIVKKQIDKLYDLD